MKIVGVAACVAGIAHTYIAQEKLIKAAESKGHTINIETQGVGGVENKLKDKDIAEADVVIIAADVSISGKDRFKGKKVIEIPTNLAIKSSSQLIAKIEKMI